MSGQDGCLEVLAWGSDYFVCRHGQLMLVVFEGDLSLEIMMEMPNWIARVSDGGANNMVAMAIHGAGSRTPTREARMLANELFTPLMEQIAGLVIIAEGDGLRPWLLRSIGYLTFSLFSTPIPIRTFSTGGEGVAWLNEQWPQLVTIEAARLEQELVVLRERLNVPPEVDPGFSLTRTSRLRVKDMKSSGEVRLKRTSDEE